MVRRLSSETRTTSTTLAGTLVVSPGAAEEPRCNLDDSLVPEILSQGALTEEEWVVVRDSFGAIRDYALRVSLADTLPRIELSSTGFCRANVGSEYLVYQQESEVSSVDVDLSDAPKHFASLSSGAILPVTSSDATTVS
jgi:hypothetical protein